MQARRWTTLYRLVNEVAAGLPRGSRRFADRVIVQWRLATMNVNEKVMALRMVLQTERLAYVVADGEYDSNPLHRGVASRGGQLVAPRRKTARALGHMRQAPQRLRSIALLEGP